MDAFTADYLTNLTAELSAPIVAYAARRFQQTWRGDETADALRRCLHTAVLAMVSRASLDEPDEATLLADIFEAFFADAAVARQMEMLVRGKPLDVEELSFLFQQAGYDADTLPGLRFPEAVAAFEAAFLEAAAADAVLRPVIQVHQDWAQTALQQEMVALMRRMVAALQAREPAEVGIEAGHIVARNVANQQTIIYQWQPPSAPAAVLPAHWESHYLEALIHQCDRLDLTPLAASEAGAEPVSVAQVFTTLYLAGVTRAEDESVADAPAPQRSGDAEAVRRGEDVPVREKQVPIIATEAIAAAPRLVILGRPGGGKSTLVNHVTAQLARRRQGELVTALPDWPDARTPLPVRIVLRRFAEWLAAGDRTGTVGDVWAYLQALLDSWGCADSYDGLRQTLIAEGGVVFFDGLDEIREPAARRAIIKGAVTDFAATLAACQVVVTSRPYAYTTDAVWRLPETAFPVVSLAPFAEEQIAAFNRAWYTQVMGPRRGWTDDQCRQHADALTQTVRRLSHLQQLAESPLLLTLMAQVHSQGGTLPANRADLYRQTVALLLSRWENRVVLDSRPGEEVPDEEVLWLGVPTGQLRDVLAQLAYQGHKCQGEAADDAALHDGRAAEITRADLKLALVERFDSGEKAEQIIAYIQHRAGLLMAEEANVYTFPHRAFQEYLAARHLLNRANWTALLRDHVRQAPDWWREVFLLSAGITTLPDNVQRLVNKLLPFGPGMAEMPLTAETAVWASMAAQALVETDFQYHVAQEEGPGDFTAVYRRVQAWLKALLVAEEVLPASVRAEAGRRLARLGDSRPGVGVDPETGLPDIVWSEEIPAGRYTIGDNESEYDDETPREVEIPRPYRLARYPITNAQFQAFLDAPDRDDPAWWRDMLEDASKFSEPEWPYANHPRETVSWHQMMSFCRWLTAKLHAGLLPTSSLAGDVVQYVITLPHEYEWEVAARWPNEDVQQRIYPWGPKWGETKANMRESGVGQTTAVGMYPTGKNLTLDLYDLSGNVSEYCRNQYDAPDADMDPDNVDMSSSRRVLRGGSWDDARYYARAASRDGYDYAYDNFGFRVVVVRLCPSHPDR